MNQSPLHAFFLGRAAAEVLRENATHCLTDILSEVGKFDAEQRDRLRQFTGQVMERAEQEVSQVGRNTAATSSSTTSESDLQATIDELRSEIARLRSALLSYRQS